MKLQHLQVIALAAGALASEGFVVRRRGTEMNFGPRHDHTARSLETRDQASCGGSNGSCPLGQCCSASGKCGTGESYCAGPDCQISYSNGKCDASKKPSGSTTATVPRNRNGKVAYDKYIVNCTEPGTVALTFDDGPYIYTEHVLDLLDKYEIKATFFITGNNLGKGAIDDEDKPWPSILRRMHKAGHQLASHSWTHQDLSAATTEIREQQVIYNEMAFRNIFGWFPKYLRPPYATCSRDSGCLDYVTKLGYHVVNFNIDTKDFENNKPTTIQKAKDTFKSGLKDTSQGYIELSHDIQQQTAYNLTEFMIKTLRDEGFRAVTVGECLGDPKENWYVNATESSGSDNGNNSGSPVASKDGTCGGRSGGKYICKGSVYGDCCSYNGWCGKTSGHCDGGCQPDFGTCNKRTDGKLIVSDNGLCGSKYGQQCKGSSYGNCCSKNGNCGSTEDYCGAGCQKGFGSCN